MSGEENHLKWINLVKYARTFSYKEAKDGLQGIPEYNPLIKCPTNSIKDDMNDKYTDDQLDPLVRGLAFSIQREERCLNYSKI